MNEAYESITAEIRAGHDAMVKARRERHAWLLAHAPHPIVRELLDAHGPSGDDAPVCGECEPVSWDALANPRMTPWPCPPWEFVNERMPK